MCFFLNTKKYMIGDIIIHRDLGYGIIYYKDKNRYSNIFGAYFSKIGGDSIIFNPYSEKKKIKKCKKFTKEDFNKHFKGCDWIKIF